MKIAITGAGGLVGAGLVRQLSAAGHELYPLVRSRPDRSGRAIGWNPATGEIDRSRLEGIDAVIHLAGENLAGYWTRAKKEQIMASRREGTRLLSDTLAGLHHSPQVLLCASATGYYGDRGSERLDESSPRGSGFLADVCAEWEAAAEPARRAGIRTLHARLGIILDPRGGALGRLLPLLRLGLGGKLGSGRQIWSWITMNDVHRAITFLLDRPALSGPVNLTAPAPVTNAEFTRTIAKFLHRPALFTAPAFALRLFLGDMAREMLLSGAQVLPRKLLDAGFIFEQPDLAAALTWLDAVSE
jgi:uncharacterized protein (TIGR01777 family)